MLGAGAYLFGAAGLLNLMVAVLLAAVIIALARPSTRPAFANIVFRSCVSTMSITAPVLLVMGVDPIWLGVMMGVLLQTSFLTPPFIGLQMVAIAILWMFPDLATWLPSEIFRSVPGGAEEFL